MSNNVLTQVFAPNFGFATDAESTTGLHSREADMRLYLPQPPQAGILPA